MPARRKEGVSPFGKKQLGNKQRAVGSHSPGPKDLPIHAKEVKISSPSGDTNSTQAEERLQSLLHGSESLLREDQNANAQPRHSVSYQLVRKELYTFVRKPGDLKSPGLTPFVQGWTSRLSLWIGTTGREHTPNRNHYVRDGMDWVFSILRISGQSQQIWRRTAVLIRAEYRARALGLDRPTRTEGWN